VTNGRDWSTTINVVSPHGDNGMSANTWANHFKSSQLNSVIATLVTVTINNNQLKLMMF